MLRKFQHHGLSPLARGTQGNFYQCQPAGRFIPAGAGNTPAFPFTRLARAVYPRWRGEHYREFAEEWAEDGLSPLARGTLPQGATAENAVRFIPAGAGNTSPLR